MHKVPLKELAKRSMQILQKKKLSNGTYLYIYKVPIQMEILQMLPKNRYQNLISCSFSFQTAAHEVCGC